MTSAKIEVLDRLVADQIAAGEVVDRPGSVVKELIENSLDAGATKINLDIDGGGITRIRVADNGSGISPDEVDLAFKRHATSKIRALADLEKVATFGFRGEALPSIVSVSKIEMRTRQEGRTAGELISIQGGETIERREVGCPKGTEIDVRDLFFNTPARLKFMKRENTEASHCIEALVRLALLRPDVSFVVRSGGRMAKQLPRVETVEERVASLFPSETLVRAQRDEDGVQVLAILGPPERARAGAGSLYTYVNGRFVRDKALLKSITQAFGGTLDHGRYPAGAISIILPVGSFDVNVHPQKIEVRFADLSSVCRAVTRTVGDLAARSAWTRQPATFTGVSDKASDFASAKDRAERTSTASTRLVPPSSIRLQSRLSWNENARPARNERLDSIEEKRFESAPSAKRPQEDPQATVPRLSDRSSDRKFAELRYIGQAKGLLLLFEDKDDLVVIDQHAAHERITYERLRAELDKGRIASQRLLMPHSVDLGPAEAERIAGFKDAFERLGLDVSQSGPDRVTIRAVPARLSEAAPERLLADVVLALEQGREGSSGDTDEKTLAAMACHGSIRGGRAVERAEAESLAAQMDGIDFAGHCPHGRPVLKRIPWREILRSVERA